EIFLRDALLLHQQPKPPSGPGVLRYQHQPTRLPIEPVNDRNLTAVRDLEREHLFQLAPERPRTARLRRVNQKKGRLLDHQEILGLRYNREIAAVVCAARLAGG